MSNKSILLMLGFIMILITVTPSTAWTTVNLVTAGDFNNILSLSNWTVRSVPAGQISGLVPIDIDGDGLLGISNAFMAQPGAPGGGSIFLEQHITQLLADNPYEFSNDLASIPVLSNSDGGVVRVWLNGGLITELDLGGIDMGVPEYAVMSQQFKPTMTDSYLLSIEFSRQFQASTFTPSLYIDNIQLISKPVPIPAPGALFLGSIGVIGVGFIRYKKSLKNSNPNI